MKRFYKITLFSVLMLFMATVQAADRYWVATSSSNWNSTANWSTSNGGTGGASVPGPSDVAYFTSSGSGNCAINATVNVAGMVMSGYSSTISQNSNSITMGYFSMSGNSYANFYGNGQLIDVNGDLTISAGTFTSTNNTLRIAGNFTRSGGSFNHNNGSVVFDGGDATYNTYTSDNFYALTIDKDHNTTLTISSGDIMYVLSTLTFSNGKLSGGNVSSYSNVTVQSGYDGGTTSLTFLGSSTQYFDLTGATSNYQGDVIINKSSGYQVVLSSDVTLGTSGQNFYAQSGILNLNNKTFTVYHAGSGTGTTYVQGNFSVANIGTYNTYKYSHTVSGTFSLTGGSTFRVYNTFIKSSSSYAEFSGGSATVYFDSHFYNYSGTFTASSGNTYYSGDFIHSGGSFNHGNGTSHFVGNSSVYTPTTSNNFYAVNINKNDGQSLTISTGKIMYVISTMSFVNGKMETGSVQTYGGVNVGAGWDGGNGELWFLGSSTQSFNLTGGESNFDGDIYINKSSGYQVQLASNLTMDAVGQDLFAYSGILNLVNRTVTIQNSGAGTGTLNVQGNFNIYGNGSFNAHKYNHVVSGHLSLSNNVIFRIYNTFIKSNSSYAEFSGGSSTLYFDGDFFNYSGTFTSTSGNAYFAGNFTHTGGSFNHGNGTCHFTGNAATYNVTTSLNFYNLTLNKNDGENLTITTGKIMYVIATLNLSNGSATTGDLQTYGNVNVASTWDGGNATLTFLGSTTQTFTLTGAEDLYDGDIVINKGSGYQLIMASNLTMDGTGQDLFVQSGQLTLNGKTLSVYNSGSNTGTMYVQGNFNVSGYGTITVYNYSHTVSGTFTISHGPTFNVLNSFTKSNSSYAEFNGGAATINILGNFVNNTGAFNSTSANIYFASNFTYTGGSFNHNNGTVNFTGNDATFNVTSSINLYNVVFNKNEGQTLTLTTGKIIYAIATTTFNNGKASGSEIRTYGNVNVESGWDGGNATLVFVGSTSQNFDLSGAEDKYDGNLSFEKSSGYVVTMYSNATFDGTGQTMYLYSGTLNLNNKTLTLRNVTDNTGTLNVLGNFNLYGNGTLNVHNHIHVTSGTFSISNGPTYHVYNNFTQSTSSYADFNGGAATLIVDGNFSKSSGAFVAPTAHFKLGGNWSITGGSYTDNGTLTFIGQNATFSTVSTFAKVVMAKDSGYALTIANTGDIIVTNSLTFTSGIFNTNDQGTLVTNCNVSVTGPTDCDNPISYVNGPFTRTLCTTTPTNMYFPVGKGGNFRATWLEPTQTTNGATTYTVEQFEGNPPNYCVPSDLTCLSKARWYRVTRGNTIPMIDPITITYCNNDGVTHPNNLRVAKQEDNCWKNMGGTGTGANKGTITSTVDFTEYGDFVLANDTDCLNPLPVKLISFEGNYANNVEYLKWVTASEENNDRFEIMRSLDGVKWSYIGEVAGSGFSERLQTYFYEDHDIPMGATVLYYRLRQVDFNGDFEYHPIIVQDLNNKKITLTNINVFPNPAKDKFSVIDLGNSRMNNRLEVSDMFGHVIVDTDFTAGTEVNTTDYPTGIYIVKVTNAAGLVVDVRKIQITK